MASETIPKFNYNHWQYSETISYKQLLYECSKNKLGNGEARFEAVIIYRCLESPKITPKNPLDPRNTV